MTGSPHSKDDEAVAADAVDVGTLVTENRTLQEENKLLEDRLLRALADAENVRRQAERSIADARQYSIAQFARELLTVVDNLERTVEAANAQPGRAVENAALLEGVRATLRAFLRTLERFGIRKIESEGKAFDPNFHEAVMELEDAKRPPGTVVRVVEPGYTIQDRLLRPARVVVSKRPARPTEAAEDFDDSDLGALWESEGR